MYSKLVACVCQEFSVIFSIYPYDISIILIILRVELVSKHSVHVVCNPWRDTDSLRMLAIVCTIYYDTGSFVSQVRELFWYFFTTMSCIVMILFVS